MIKTLLIDDEQAARDVLRQLLNDFCPDVDIIGEAKDTFEAEELIGTTQPDLLFLDIEMPNRTGIDFLKQQGEINYDVIFTTAFEKYAIEAIKLSALDYLVKPIDIQELIKAVHRAKTEKGRIEKIKNLIHNENSQVKNITIHHQGGIEFVPVDAILFCEADGSYTKFHIRDNKHILASKTLKSFEDILLNQKFFRCHKSYIVSIDEVSGIDHNGNITLKNGQKVPVSRRKKDEIVNLISGQ